VVSQFEEVCLILLRRIVPRHLKGCTLQLTAAQIKHCAQHGSGRFTDLVKKGYNFLKRSLRKGLTAGLNYGKDFIEDKIAGAAGLQEGKGWLGDIGKKLAHGGVDFMMSGSPGTQRSWP
jgi:hypothetical protein